MAGADTSREDDELEDHKAEYDRAADSWSRTYSDALDDYRFGRLHEHWPEKLKRERELQGKPCLTIPRLPPLIRQVVNDARQNKPSIVVSPADDDADPKTAEVMNGLIRQIERASHAGIAYDTAIDQTVTCGFGYFKINTQYATDDSFEQDIVIETVENPFSIVPDPDDKGATSLNWMSAFEIEEMRKKAFEAEYPDCGVVSFDDRGEARRDISDGETLTIARRWVREKTKRKIVALSGMDPMAMQANPDAAMQAEQLWLSTQVVDLAVYEANKELFEVLGVKLVGQPREVPSFKVKRLTMSGAEIIDTLDWAGKYIPIVAVYGVDVNVEGERYLEGIIRPAKDAQRMFNYWRTKSTEVVALAPNAPWLGRTGQFSTDAEKWATANQQNHAYLEWDGEPGDLPPQRQPFAGVPAGALQEAMNASDDMKSITGIYDASLGARSNETSGKAIRARQMEGDTGTFHYIDNLSRGIATAGEMLLDLIPKVYSTPRTLRILGPDMKTVERVKVNQPTEVEQKGDDGRLEVISHTYDLTAGKYDLTVSVGPSYTSRREEAASQMIEFIRAYPQAAPIIGDLLAQNLDWPGADEVAERLKALLPAALQGENAEAVAAQEQVKQLAQMIGQLRAENTSLKADKGIKERETDIKAYEAETKRLSAVVGKEGAGYDPVQMQALIAQTLDTLASPDIAEAMASGQMGPQDIVSMIAQRMQPPPQEQQPVEEQGPPIAA